MMNGDGEVHDLVSSSGGSDSDSDTDEDNTFYSFANPPQNINANLNDNKTPTGPSSSNSNSSINTTNSSTSSVEAVQSLLKYPDLTCKEFNIEDGSGGESGTDDEIQFVEEVSNTDPLAEQNSVSKKIKTESPQSMSANDFKKIFNNVILICGFKCPTLNCNESFNSEVCLIIHQKYRHAEYKCKIENCPWTFDTQFKVYEHEERHEGGIIYNPKGHLELNGKEIKPKIVEVFNCLKCYESFGDKATLDSHVLSFHPNPFKCKFSDCLETFLNTTELLIHQNEAKHGLECSVCSKKFKTRQLCIDHENHKHDIEYICTFYGCKKSFVEEAWLETHMIYHSEDDFTPVMVRSEFKLCEKCYRPYCPLLTNHVCLLPTKTRNFTCDQGDCKASFRYSSHLKFHKTNLHPFWWNSMALARVAEQHLKKSDEIFGTSPGHFGGSRPPPIKPKRAAGPLSAKAKAQQIKNGITPTVINKGTRPSPRAKPAGPLSKKVQPVPVAAAKVVVSKASKPLSKPGTLSKVNQLKSGPASRKKLVPIIIAKSKQGIVPTTNIEKSKVVVKKAGPLSKTKPEVKKVAIKSPAVVKVMAKEKKVERPGPLSKKRKLN